MRATLNRSERETVALMVRADTVNVYGEETTGWAPQGTTTAHVQPVELEEATRAGLQLAREQLRLFLPPIPVSVPSRFRLRGRDWQALSVEHWQHHTLVMVEGVRSGE